MKYAIILTTLLVSTASFAEEASAPANAPTLTLTKSELEAHDAYTSKMAVLQYLASENQQKAASVEQKIQAVFGKPK